MAINNQGQIIGNGDSARGVTHGFVWWDGRITDLGTLFGRHTDAVAISGRGQVVGWSDTGVRHNGREMNHAFVWHDGRMTDLGTLGGDFTRAWAINDNGQIVGDSGTMPGSYGDFEPFVWRGGRMNDLGPLHSDGDADAINDRGQIVGNSGTDPVATLWWHGRRIVLDRGSPDGYSSAVAINAAGQIVVQSFDASRTPNERGYIWQDGHMTDLAATTQDEFATAVAINARGEVIGHCARRSKSRPCLWQNGTVRDLGTPGGDRGEALAINAQGQVVGHISSGTAGKRTAFVWQNGTATPLPGLSNHASTDAVALNDKGQIVGWSKASGHAHGRAVLWRLARGG